MVHFVRQAANLTGPYSFRSLLATKMTIEVIEVAWKYLNCHFLLCFFVTQMFEKVRRLDPKMVINLIPHHLKIFCTNFQNAVTK